MIDEKHYLKELRNIIKGVPLWPGDTISHNTANECEARGWVRRDGDGCWVPTPAGVAANAEALAVEYEETADP